MFWFIFVFGCFELSLVHAQCPNGWSDHDDFCYHFSHDTETWAGAKIICQMDGAYLVEINDARENQFLKGLVAGAHGEAWLGGNDLNVEGEWEWAHSRTDLKGYSNFHSGEPNNGGNDENCMEMESSGLWNDDTCHKYQQYICEKSLSSSSCSLYCFKCYLSSGRKQWSWLHRKLECLQPCSSAEAMKRSLHHKETERKGVKRLTVVS